MSDKETPIGEVLLKNVRLSFADIYTKSKDRRDKDDPSKIIPGQFKANGLMSKDEDDADSVRNMRMLKAAKARVMEAKWGKNLPKLKPEKICVRDGDLEDYDGYEGHWYISANESEQPVLITRRKDEKGEWEAALPGQIYSGCYVNMIVVLWAQDNEHGKRINARLKAVQFYKKGDPFSGSGPINPNEKFAEIEEDDGEDMGPTSNRTSSTSDDDDDDVI